MNADDHMSVLASVRTYLGVFGALLVLTIVTVGASRFHLAIPLAIGVALLIAVVKGSLVASFFMHLVAERPSIYAALILTAVLLAVLLLLPLLVTLDRIGAPRTF